MITFSLEDSAEMYGPSGKLVGAYVSPSKVGEGVMGFVGDCVGADVGV